MLQWHPTALDLRPAFPTHCPDCGAVVRVFHMTDPARSVETASLQWHWRAWCWYGHVVEALPEQRRLWD
jgi:hypothetical protein